MGSLTIYAELAGEHGWQLIATNRVPKDYALFYALGESSLEHYRTLENGYALTRIDSTKGLPNNASDGVAEASKSTSNDETTWRWLPFSRLWTLDWDRPVQSTEAIVGPFAFDELTNKGQRSATNWSHASAERVSDLRSRGTLKTPQELAEYIHANPLQALADPSDNTANFCTVVVLERTLHEVLSFGETLAWARRLPPDSRLVLRIEI